MLPVRRVSDQSSDVWPVVHAERASLIELLASLDDDAWQTPSLCGDWTVHDVVAHVVDTAKTTRMSFVAGLVAARFDFDRQNARGVASERGATPTETLARFRAVANRTSTPPAAKATRLVEAFVHGEDIRRPLGQSGHYPTPAVEQALRYQLKTAVSFGGGKEYVAGLRLIADDAAFVHGEGPEITGPLLSLLVAASGRAAAIDDLAGSGKTMLATRIGVR